MNCALSMSLTRTYCLSVLTEGCAISVFVLIFFLAVLCSMWGLSSLTRNQTHAMPHALEAWCFNHQTTREVPQ